MHERDFMEGTRGTMAVDWEERIDTQRMRRERKERALQGLRDSRLGSMLLINDPNVRYVTGLAMTGGSGADHYTLLTEAGDVVHWDTADHASNQRFNCPWLDDIRYACPGLGNVPRADARPEARGTFPRPGQAYRTSSSHGQLNRWFEAWSAVSQWTTSPSSVSSV